MGNLVIVESPAKAGTIQKFLGAGYTVKSSFGHIRDLRENSLSIDVENNFAPEYAVPSEKRKVVTDLKKAAQAADSVLLATDEDREGEAISWHLYETLDLNKVKTKRIVFHEITKTAILDAIKNPRDINMNLVDAQQARRVLDRLVGFELSPVLWRKIQPKLSAGRVQSVALRLVVDREREILSFNREQYYKVEAVFHPESAAANVRMKATLNKKFGTVDEARTFLESCIGAEFKITGIEKKDGVRTPPPPFTTSTLQQEAAHKLGFSVNQTMNLAQGLYEAGLITYMRTDSTNLSSLAIGTAKKFICETFGEKYHKARQYKTKSKGAQEAHEAIRPTYIENTSINGTPQEQKLYELIWKRTVASQMLDAKVIRTTINIEADKTDGIFTVQAMNVVFDGFLKLYIDAGDAPDGGEEDVILPEVAAGDKMRDEEITADCKFTAPPTRYSEAGLVKKLEELGIGRPSTYAPTISTLTKGRGYIVRGNKTGEKISVVDLSLKKGVITSSNKTETVGAEKGRLLPQDIGIIVTDYLTSNFEDILDYGFTANVEKEFDDVALGKEVWTDVISEFYEPFHKKVESTMQNGGYSKVSREIGIDPKDGQMIVAKYGQFGPYVQKGEGENKVTASLAPGQLIESLTLAEATKLFELPRTVGNYNGIDIVCMTGRYGPYMKYGDKNISLPRGENPTTISFDTCVKAIETAASKPANETLAEFGDGILVLNGRYGPYIKQGSSNYKIPRGTNAASLTEEDCKAIIANSTPSAHKRRFVKKK